MVLCLEIDIRRLQNFRFYYWCTHTFWLSDYQVNYIFRSKFIKSGNFSSVTELANKVVEACDNDSYINSFVLSHEEFQDFIDGLLKETNTLNITELGKPKTSIAIVEENIEKVDDKIVNFIFFLMDRICLKIIINWLNLYQITHRNCRIYNRKNYIEKYRSKHRIINN